MRFSLRLAATASILAIFVSTVPTKAMSLKEAVAEALATNPEILQAAENREAIEFELRQAEGLYLPSIDLDAAAGTRRLDNASRRRLGSDEDTLYPAEVGLSISQTLFDGGNRRSEVERQAARVDGASMRVYERSEGIALRVVQEYLEILLQSEIIKEIRNNVAFHRQMLGEIQQSEQGGALTAADTTQAQERLLAAQAQYEQATEDLEVAKIRFHKLVGAQIANPKYPGSVSGALPKSLDAAITQARAQSPRIAATVADVDAADAHARGARAAYLPKISLQGRAQYGQDTDGSDDDGNDLEALVVARWNLYRGGQDVAKEQERIRRASEQRYALHQAHREIEETVRTAWDRRIKQAELAGTLRKQADANARLVTSYREQFRVGQRSLLDVLEAQNTRYNVAVQSKTSAYASVFEEYRILAATGSLARTMGAAPIEQAQVYARDEFAVPQGQEPNYKRLPSKQASGLPLDLLAPVRK
jgi:adhesin transport system outer membrane protein